MRCKPEQPENAPATSDVTESETMTEVRPQQPEKAPLPTTVTESGMTSEVRLLQLA